MILVDTNVIVDIWKNKNDKYSHVFSTEPVCICGVVRSELLHGAYFEKNLNEISSALDLITELNIEKDEWDAFGRFLYGLRVNGLTVPYPDALIAYTAIAHDVPVLTKDKHFRLIQVVDSRLKLFDISENSHQENNSDT